MAFDSSLIHLLVGELKASVLGRILKGIKGAKEGFFFDFGRGESLVFMLTEANSSIFLSRQFSWDSEEVEPSFVLLLRKHLIGSALVGIDQHDFDRVILLDFEIIYPGRLIEKKRLYVEFIPRKLNAILVGEGRKIIGSWKKGSWEANFYLPPSPTGLNPLYWCEFDERLFKANLYRGLSKNLLKFLQSFPSVEVGWSSWLKGLKERSYKPTLFLSTEGYPIDYWAFDYDTDESLRKRYFDNLSELIEFFVKEKRSFDLSREEEQRKIREIEDRRKYLLRKKENLLALLSKKEEVRKLEIWGEMIFANLSSIPERVARVELVNPYTGKLEEVKLDPSLTPVMNAQSYFKEASKLKRGVEKAEEELKKVEEELSKLEEGFRPSLSADIKKRDEDGKPFREFNYRGWNILVGKEGSSNEILTFKIASNEDVWLHVKGSPGSHVVIRNPSRSEIPQDVLEFAASLAAYYSKAKMNAKVPVDYTLVKYVKRHPSGKRGAVLIRNQKTIWVRPRSGETS